MNAQTLQQAALHLPKSYRANLVHMLLASLDEPSEADIRQLWLHEAGRRAADIDQGKLQLVSAEELEAQVQALYK